MSYTVKELADLLGVTDKTIFRWIDNGLKTVGENKKPILIIGKEAKEFMRKKNLRHKSKLGRSEFYCLTCKKPRHAKRYSLEVLSDRTNGRCRVCSGKISRINKPYQKDYQIPAPPVQMSIFSSS